jgi:glycine cleavage system H lipoate-binding protein/ABC-type phosphate transport system substrate-binding protein
MKTFILLFAATLWLHTAATAGSKTESVTAHGQQGTVVKVISTPDLAPLTAKWAREYNRLNPGKEITVIPSGPGQEEYLRFSSVLPADQPGKDPVWRMAVGRQVVVPVMNAGNPYSKELKITGITQEKLQLMLNDPEKRTWGTVLSNSSAQAVHFYMVSEEAVFTALNRYLNEDPARKSGVMYGSRDEVTAAVQQDPLAIGICPASILQGDERLLLSGRVQFLPIDRDANGTIDYREAIYSDMNSFQRGVWIGKYPKALISDIFVTGNALPADENEVAFLKWVLTDGQAFVASAGYSELSGSESQSQFDKLGTATIEVSPAKEASRTGAVLLLVALVLAGGWMITLALRHYRKQQNVTPDFDTPQPGFSPDSMVLPKGLYFDKSHTWAFMEKDGNITVGLDDFLQHIIGPVTRIDMKKAGDSVKKGDILFSVIQLGKQLCVYAPFSGVIRQFNTALATDATLLNTSPYEKGWVYTIEPTHWIKEVQLMDLSEKYRRWLDAEFSRLKDFLAAILRPEGVQHAHVVLQDGGELKEGLLSEFGPDVWEDFQSNFLDTFR